MVFMITIAGLISIVLIFIQRTGAFEGRPSGEKYEVVLNDINENQTLIIDIAQKYDLNPRVLGVSIFAERAINYVPIFEDVLSFIFGSSVGFAQVNVSSLVYYVRIINAPTHEDSVYYIIGNENKYNYLRKIFIDVGKMRYWELKYRLSTNKQFNVECAAFLLKLAITRYKNTKNGFDITNNPSISATLYHIKFPKRIAGKPDNFGLFAQRVYVDSQFIPITNGLIGKCETQIN